MNTNLLYFSIRIFTTVNKHEHYMSRCFQLAERGRGNVSPNPMVGAVLVYNDSIIGEGYHKQYGSFHAEVNCIHSVKKENHDLIKDSTLYVSLEPCNHHGKTPPCTDFILQNNIQRVVVACKDSCEKVNGAGLQKLQQAGVHVIMGVLEKEAIALNERFFTFHTQRRPYIILKWAQTSNQMISGNHKERLHITNELTNKLVHRWRSEECAILVGTHTVLMDNPALTNRLWIGKNPCRIYIDKHLIVDDTFQLNDASVPTMILKIEPLSKHCASAVTLWGLSIAPKRSTIAIFFPFGYM